LIDEPAARSRNHPLVPEAERAAVFVESAALLRPTTFKPAKSETKSTAAQPLSKPTPAAGA
jgi:hypothetical protein